MFNVLFSTDGAKFSVAGRPIEYTPLTVGQYVEFKTQERRQRARSVQSLYRVIGRYGGFIEIIRIRVSWPLC